MKHRSRQRRNRRKPEVKQPVSQNDQLAALHAVALGLLLAGLRNDGTLDREGDCVIAAGPKVVAGVLGFMTAHASEAYEHEYGGREAAIAEVERQLAAILSEIPDSGEPL